MTALQKRRGHHGSTPPRSIKLDVRSRQRHPPSSKIKNNASKLFARVTRITLFIVILLCTLHYQTIDQYEPERSARFTLPLVDDHLFDPMGLPPTSDLRGKYDGCLLVDGQIAPHHFRNSVFVSKDIEIVNGTGTNLISHYRLPAYDYDEVKGLVASFNNAFIYGIEPLVYDCHVLYRPGGAADLNINLFEMALGRKYNHNHNIAKGIPPPPGTSINVISGTVVLLSQFMGERFYHWLAECLPRLVLVKDYLDAHPDAKLLFLHGDEANQVILNMLGIHVDRIISYYGHQLYFAKHLLVPTATAEGRIIPRAARLMNQHFRREISKQNVSVERRLSPSIIIQLRGPGPRYMENGHKLVEAVRNAYPNANVQIFRHNETMRSAMQMHYGADLVIAPHGAGEANALFMRPGAIMLEIYPAEANWLNPCHNYTSKSVGVKHYFVQSETGTYVTHMTVDIDAVLRHLLEFFS